MFADEEAKELQVLIDTCNNILAGFISPRKRELYGWIRQIAFDLSQKIQPMLPDSKITEALARGLVDGVLTQDFDTRYGLLRARPRFRAFEQARRPPQRARQKAANDGQRTANRAAAGSTSASGGQGTMETVSVGDASASGGQRMQQAGQGARPKMSVAGERRTAEYAATLALYGPGKAKRSRRAGKEETLRMFRKVEALANEHLSPRLVIEEEIRKMKEKEKGEKME